MDQLETEEHKDQKVYQARTRTAVPKDRLDHVVHWVRKDLQVPQVNNRLRKLSN